MSGPRHKSTSRKGAAANAPLRLRGQLGRRLFYLVASLGLSALGGTLMFEILRPNGFTLLEACLLALFIITFTWITMAFVSGAIGFVLQGLRLDPLTLRRSPGLPPRSTPITTRTAVVMPIYNEDVARVMAGFEANLRSLAAAGDLEQFDFYLLSDTQDPAIAERELAGWQHLRKRLGETLAARAFYRRRSDNRGRKVGNLADFCQRWGSYYEAMIVLDADSLMTGECMRQLVQAMAANPKAGLIQTVPIPVRQETFFGRYLQFAAELYSPMLATGLAFWQTDSANYWGHNAIIRVSAFINSCGLPPLPGPAPFGGEILSHDFVEAALLRRAGWNVLLLSQLRGSYEEVPSNIIDYATRDRRWVQGNIQHLALLKGRGLHIISRLHFMLGAVAYISTLIWLIMLGLSTVDAVLRTTHDPVFFVSEHQLFPIWPIARTDLIYSMLYVTAALLFGPKLMGLMLGLWQRSEQFGGRWNLLKSALLETLFAILIAPLMMVFHSYFVVCVLLGRKVSWDAQAREGRMVAWRDAFRHTWLPSVAALVWGTFTYYLTPTFFWWLAPVLLGLILGAPLVRFSSSFALGRWLRAGGTLLVPSEVSPPSMFQEVDETMREAPPVATDLPTELHLLPERWHAMPVQSFDDVPEQPQPEQVSSKLRVS